MTVKASHAPTEFEWATYMHRVNLSSHPINETDSGGDFEGACAMLRKHHITCACLLTRLNSEEQLTKEQCVTLLNTVKPKKLVVYEDSLGPSYWLDAMFPTKQLVLSS